MTRGFFIAKTRQVYYNHFDNGQEEEVMDRKTFSAEETFAYGEKLGRSAKAGEVYTLVGDLGAGKTVFAQGFARGLGIEEPVNSPTFTILQVYDTGRLPLYHFDVYRIDDPDEMEEIGWEDCVYGDGVTMIEWADRIRDILPKTCREIRIEKDPQRGFDYRRILLSEDNNG